MKIDFGVNLNLIFIITLSQKTEEAFLRCKKQQFDNKWKQLECQFQFKKKQEDVYPHFYHPYKRQTYFSLYTL